MTTQEKAQTTGNVELQQKNVLKKKKSRYFETYINKVLRKSFPDGGVTSNSKQQLNSMLCIIANIISEKSVEFTKLAKKRTLSDREVVNAVQVLFSSDLGLKAVEEGHRAKDSYVKNTGKKSGGMSRQQRSGLIFPPSVAEKFLRDFGYSNVMVSNFASIYLAAVLEYVASDMLELAYNRVRDEKRVRVTIRDLELSVRNDKCLNKMFVENNISFLGGGNVPYVHPSLLCKKNNKKKRKIMNEDGTKKPHRFRPGTVAIREIKKYQKSSNCLTFAKFPFEKIVRELFSEHLVKLGQEDKKLKISKDVFTILQYFIEQNVVDILQNSNFAAIHAGRVKMMPVDINFVRFVQDGYNNPHNSTPELEVKEDEPVAEVKKEVKKEKKVQPKEKKPKKEIKKDTKKNVKKNKK